MYTLLTFLKTIQVIMIFLILELIAGYFFFRGNPYQQAVAINTVNNVMGGIYTQTSSVGDYFSLSSVNRKLAEENAKLRQSLSQYQTRDTSAVIPTQINDTYIAARVINNSIAGQNNYITIDKGSIHGIVPEMALLNNDGIVGYIVACSKNFSVAMSVLNRRNFRTSGKLKETDNTGKISWNGSDYKTVQFTGVPKYAQISIGDTILTQYSDIFPDNYPIGTVTSSELYNGTNFNINVKLFADMYRLTYVYAVSNPLQKERTKLEKANIEE